MIKKFKIFYEDKDLDDFEEEVIADCPEEDTAKEKEKTKNENVYTTHNRRWQDGWHSYI